MSFDLEGAIIRAMEDDRKTQLEEERKAREEYNKTAVIAIKTLHKELIEELGDSLHKTLNFEYDYGETRHTASRAKIAFAKFTDSEMNWSVAKVLWDSKWVWSISPDAPHYHAQPRTLRDRLLILIGNHREEKARREQQMQEKRDAEARRVEDSVKKNAERQEQIAASIRIDQEVQLVVEAEIAKARAEMWQWAEGVRITYYLLTYCVGSCFNDYGEPTYDYRRAYTTSDRRSKEGWTVIYPLDEYRCDDEPLPPRTIRLNNESHKPVYERFYASDLESLPHDLTVNVNRTLEGIRQVQCADGEWRLEFAEGGKYEIRIRFEPVEWVKKLVESEAAKAAKHG